MTHRKANGSFIGIAQYTIARHVGVRCETISAEFNFYQAHVYCILNTYSIWGSLMLTVCLLVLAHQS